jgi:hypothetical protein
MAWRLLPGGGRVGDRAAAATVDGPGDPAGSIQEHRP